jgi:hypothetical protein
MKLRQGEEYNASGTPNAHLTDEILRVYLVNGQENRDFLKDIILNMIQEMGKGQIVKVEPQSENSSRFFGINLGHRHCEYYSKEYNINTGNFENKRWLFNTDNQTSMVLYNEIRKVGIIQAEAYRGEIKMATTIERGGDTTISKLAYEINISSIDDVLKPAPAPINGMEPGLPLRPRLSVSMVLSGNEDFSNYKEAARVSTACIKHMQQHAIKYVDKQIQPGDEFYDHKQKIKKNLEEAFDK